MHAFPHRSTRVSQSLDGIWAFAFLGEKATLDGLDFSRVAFDDRMAVPGVFDTTPRYAGRRGVALYRRRVSVPPGRRLQLSFGGLGLWARVFWDGAAVGTIDLPYSGCALEFASGAAAQHELVVAIDNRFDPVRSPLFCPYYDFYAFGGIFRSVLLHELPACSLERVRVSTLDHTTGRVSLDLELLGAVPARLAFDLAFDGRPAQHREEPVIAGHVRIEAVVPDFAAWSPEAPHLHTVTVSVAGDAVTERFGIRTVAVADGAILVNGRPQKLLGYCRHESHMEFGPVQPLPLLISDLQHLKTLGCNFIRGTHYPQDQRFLDLCDELGFLFWEESLGWGNRPEHLADPGFRDAQLRQTALMVDNSFNHPSVIMWGFLNEAASDAPESVPLFDDLIGLLRRKDPSRLVTYASFKPETDLHFEKADIVSLNAYPGWYSTDAVNSRPIAEVVPFFDNFIATLEKRGLGQKPFIISEFGAGAIYGCHDSFRSLWSEEYQAEMLETICRFVLDRPRVNGISLWQFADGRTYTSNHALRRPRCINDKGTLDEYRRPKLAYETVKRLFTGRS